MARFKFTKKSVENAAVGQHFDLNITGFGLRVQPSGLRTFFFKYRHYGKQHKKSLGRYGVLTAPEATQMAREAWILTRQAIDPFAAPEDKLDDLVEDKKKTLMVDFIRRYQKDYVALFNKESTGYMVAVTIDKHIIPNLGHIPVCKIERQHLVKLHRKMAGIPYQANRTLYILSKMMNWAEDEGYRPLRSNPCYRLKKYKERGRERFLTGAELKRFGNTLRRYEGQHPIVVGLLRMLLFTGARKGELLNLTWDQIDDSGSIRLQDSKTGPKTIFLSSAAREVLNAIPRYPGNPHVFPGQRPGMALTNPGSVWKVIKEDAKLNNLRLHDLRHSFASIAAANGLGLQLIGKMLGHADTQTTERYAHLCQDAVAEGVERIGEDIKGLVETDDA